MKLGLPTPVVTRVPGIVSPWESEGTVEDIVRIVQSAESEGYWHVTCAEHVIIPEDETESRGPCFWDPAATLGYLAAFTGRIHLLTYVIVLGYHHPLVLAKQYGTLDRLSKGRVVLGVGIGSLREEFSLLDVPFRDRAPRADDALKALRVAYGKTSPRYEGDYYRFDGVVVDPTAPREAIEIWVGGRTKRSLQRALALGDGWMPFGLSLAEVGRSLTAATEELGRDRLERFDIILNHEPRRLDPLGDPTGAARSLEAVASVGATGVNIRFARDSPAHFVDQVGAMMRVARETVPIEEP